MPPTADNALASQLELAFEDNRLAAQLYGDFDQNLALVEQRLFVSATPRGNHVLLKGAASKVDQARRVLESLYTGLEEGRTVDIGDVDAVIRMVETEDSQLTLPTLERRGKVRMAQIATRKSTIVARTPAQDAYMRAMDRSELVFGIGPAGTGKTYVAVAHAASLLERGDINRIILSRPAVEAGERLGFLPGDMKDKVDPYLRPLYDALYDMMKPENVERCITSGIIEVAPLAFMRGRTLANAVVILDEAQNTTSMQMKMFLTRLGENSKMIVTGDPTQVDLPRGERSGLVEAVNLLDGVEGVHISRFNDKDVVRHALVGRIVRAYEADTARRLAEKDGDTTGLARTLGTLPRA
ncbi:PhoH family protein [Devosia sp. FJ2-5-3]|uniref:PhoH family protein n=1 Tax=Devosia sp. FJ2-5-3 TaxID=2976680 RepID=UPI0023D8415D|nr:PhoH family protein [Devosia sp. FJ2-5-3]WEJ58461.1 PhoH family protein [Devosia sp. FJ2-5-3]